jgi:hypothetical protein
MRLKTIWTLPGMTVRNRVKETADAAARTIAHRLPKRIKFWAFVLVGTAAMNDQDVVPEVRFADLLDRAETQLNSPSVAAEVADALDTFWETKRADAEFRATEEGQMQCAVLDDSSELGQAIIKATRAEPEA